MARLELKMPWILAPRGFVPHRKHRFLGDSPIGPITRQGSTEVAGPRPRVGECLEATDSQQTLI